MAKKIETKPFGVQSTFNGDDSLPGGLNVIEPTFNNKAFSIVYEGKKRYSVVAIPFSAGSSFSTGQVEVVESGLDLYEAQHVFKTSTVKAGLFDEGLDKTE